MSARDEPSWDRPETVASFVGSPPNRTLMRFAGEELGRRGGSGVALDLGCGAARNARPLAELGWTVIGLDLSWPMLRAAVPASGRAPAGERFVLAPMDALPIGDRTADLLVAHGIWNLARSSREFRQAIAEAGRVAAPSAGLFLFTFSRRTLPEQVQPVRGESFVFTDFSGEPQCFLTRDQLLEELGRFGFEEDPAIPWTEHNAAASRGPFRPTVPVIHEATFRFAG